jgi:hypothetical protein
LVFLYSQPPALGNALSARAAARDTQLPMKQSRLRSFAALNVLFAVALLGPACASKPAAPIADSANSAEAPVEPAGADPSATPLAEPSAAPPDTPVSSPAASSSAAEEGSELPKNCNFKVKGFCFAEQEEACAASDCPPGKCMVLESHPARIKCAK